MLTPSVNSDGGQHGVNLLFCSSALGASTQEEQHHEDRDSQGPKQNPPYLPFFIVKLSDPPFLVDLERFLTIRRALADNRTVQRKNAGAMLESVLTTGCLSVGQNKFFRYPLFYNSIIVPVYKSQPHIIHHSNI